MSEALLASYAAKASQTKGRTFPEPAPKYRSEFQRDRDRIIHSAAFRRLEYKTQVFVNHEGDMFRTRLTHSIEVAQIGRSIARILKLNEELTEAISLAHDLGHTPFGHSGQEVLNQCMQPYGGFEHNLQSLRVVDTLEEKYVAFPGLNLTFEAREGILKHCSVKNARQLGEVGERFVTGRQPGLEAQVANISDAIAYNNHDVDDGLRARLITIEQLSEIPLFGEQLDTVMHTYPGIDERKLIHEVIRRIINAQVIDLVEQSRRSLEEVAAETIEDVRQCDRAIMGFSDEMAEKHRQLKRFLRENLYNHYRVYRMSLKAQRMLRELFELFFNEPMVLPPETQHKIARLERDEGESGRARGVADYIAGMTDRYAILEYKKLFNADELT